MQNLSKIANWVPSETDFDELIKAGLIYALFITKNSIKAQRNGIAMIIDMSGFGFSHARQISYSNVTKMANCIIFGSPFKIINANIVNSPYIFEKVWGVVQYAIPEYYRKFVSFITTFCNILWYYAIIILMWFIKITVTQSDFTNLHKLVDKDALPGSLGGTVLEEEAWEEDLEAGIWGSNYVEEFLGTIGSGDKTE